MKHIIIVFLFFQMLSSSVLAQQYKYHVVKRGETVAEIARRYNIDQETIFRFNPDARNGITPNTKLVVPLSAVTSDENKTFKTHRVERKETLFSLSQQYNVSIEEIKRYNKHLYSEELQRGERIRIPLEAGGPNKREPEKKHPGVNPLELSTKEHVVLPKETLYGISRKYNITIAELQRLNPNLETLRPGMVLKVRNGHVEKVIDVPGDLFEYYLVKPKETLFTLTRRFGISRDSLLTLNPALADGLKSGMVLKIPNQKVPEVAEYSEEEFINLEEKINSYSTKNLVVMLPFNLDKIVETDTSSNAEERVKKDRVLQISLDFYSGVLMAVDSAKNLGISTRLTTLDTRQNSVVVRNIINTNDFSNVDAVIGPLVRTTTETAASVLQQENVPVVSPFTPTGADQQANFLQTRPSDQVLSDAMIGFISERVAGKNLVVIADSASAGKKRQLLSLFPQARVVDPQEGSFIDPNELTGALEEDRPNWILLEAKKIGVISNTTSFLNSLTEDYDITLFTTNRNNSFDSDNISNRHLSQLRFHFPSVDRVYSPERHAAFVEKYLDLYGVVPNRYAVRGFDITYDILLRLASSERLYDSLEGEGTTQYIENKFDYDRVPSGGYRNTAIYIMAYDKNLNLNVVQ